MLDHLVVTARSGEVRQVRYCYSAGARMFSASPCNACAETPRLSSWVESEDDDNIQKVKVEIREATALKR